MKRWQHILVIATWVILLVVMSVFTHCQTVDKKFFAVEAFHAGSLALDGYSTRRYELSGSCSEIGSVWLYGRNPSVKRLTLVMLGEFVAVGVAGYELKKHNIKLGRIPLWPVPAIASSVPHLYSGVYNLEHCR